MFVYILWGHFERSIYSMGGFRNRLIEYIHFIRTYARGCCIYSMRGFCGCCIYSMRGFRRSFIRSYARGCCIYSMRAFRYLQRSAIAAAHYPSSALSRRSFFAKEPLIIGLFCEKWPMKIRHHMGLCHPVNWVASWLFRKITFLERL